MGTIESEPVHMGMEEEMGENAVILIMFILFIFFNAILAHFCEMLWNPDMKSAAV